MLGIDLSYEEITYDEALDLKANGIGVVAQCLWTGQDQPPSRVITLRNCFQAGMTLVGYASITASMPGAWHMQQARNGVPDDLWQALVRVPVDVELPGLTLGMVTSAADEVARQGKPHDVYTNYNTWVNILGNPTRPTGYGLWNAYWDGDPDADFPRLPFGGWLAEEVWGEQYQGGTYFRGQYVDLDVFQFQPPAIPVPQNGKDQLRLLLNAALAEVEKL